MKKRLAGLAGSLLLVACTPHSASPDAVPAWDAQVSHGRLPNGMAWRLVRDTSQGPRLDLRLTVRAGSIDEAPDQIGVAHLVEHLAFYSHGGQPQDVRARMQALGWEQGRQFNAVTNYDRTQYMLSPTRGTAELLPALDALATLTLAADYSAADLDHERAVVVEEWRGGLGVAQRMNEQRTATQRVGSRYPEHRTIGNEAAIREASWASLQDFQHRWYRPDNMVLNVVGDVSPQALQAALTERFSQTPATALPPRDQRELPLLPGLKIFRLQDPQTGSRQVNLLWRLHQPELAADDLDGLRERLIERLTLAAVQDQLRRQPRNTDVRSLTVQKTLVGAQSAVFALSASVEGSRHDAGLGQLLEEVARLRRYGLNPEDLTGERDKIRSIAQGMLKGDEQRTFEQWVQRLSDAALDDAPIRTRHGIAQRYLAVLDSITVQDLNQRLRHWTDASDQVLQFTAPSQTTLILPTVAQVQALRAAIDPARLAAPAQAQVKPTEATPVFDVAPPAAAGQIVERTSWPAEQVEQWRLSNGDRLVWLRRPGADGKVQLKVVSAAGYQRAGVPAWRLQMAEQLGSQSTPGSQPEAAWKAWKLAHKLQEDRAQTDGRLDITWQAPPEQLQALLSAYRVGQTRQVEPAALDEAREQLAPAVARRDDPNSVQARALAQLRQGAASIEAPNAAELAALDVATLEADWQSLLRQPVTYYLMTDAPLPAVEQAVREQLAALPRAAVAAATPRLPQAGSRSQTMAIALEPRATVKLESFSEHPWSPAAAARVSALRDLANTALKQRLRSEAGGIYRLTIDSQLDPDHQRIETRLSFSCDPARVDELTALARQTLAELPAELNAARVKPMAAHLAREEAKRRDDAQTQLRRLILSDRHYGDPRYLREQGQLSSALTVATLKPLAAQLMPTANLIRFTVLPAPEAAAR